LPVALFLALFATSCRQTPTTPPPDTNDCHGMLIVTVQNGEGHAIQGALVTVTGEGDSVHEHTGDLGTASFSNLHHGSHLVHITMDGYAVNDEHVTITCGDTVRMTRTLTLVQHNTECNAGVITLILRDSATGASIDGGSASLYLHDHLIGTQTISANGNSWDGLVPGVYTIRLSKDGYPVKYITLDSLGCNEHRTTDPRWGANHTTDCCQGVFEVSVTDGHTQHVIAGATVVLSKDNMTSRTGTTTDGGVVRYGELCEGTYHIIVSKDGYHSRDTNITETCNGTHGITIVLTPNTTNDNCMTTSFALHVIDSTHQDVNVQGATVIIYNQTTNTQAATGTTTDGGNYSATGLPGHTTYVVRISKDGYNLKYLTFQITDCREVHETILLGAH
jgi:hypothetical protein